MRQIRNLIWSTAIKRGGALVLGSGERARPNIRQVHRKMQDALGETVDQTTLTRVMNLDRHAGPGASDDYQPSLKLKLALMAWLDLDDEIALIRAWKKAKPAPPIAPKPPRQ